MNMYWARLFDLSVSKRRLPIPQLRKFGVLTDTSNPVNRYHPHFTDTSFWHSAPVPISLFPYPLSRHPSPFLNALLYDIIRTKNWSNPRASNFKCVPIPLPIPPVPILTLPPFFLAPFPVRPGPGSSFTRRPYRYLKPCKPIPPAFYRYLGARKWGVREEMAIYNTVC